MARTLTGRFEPLRWSLARPEPHDDRLAGGSEQRAVLRPQVRGAVTEAVGDGVNADVDQHPPRRYQLHDAHRVVEAVSTGPHAERLPDATGDEVPQHSQRPG